MEFNGLPLHPLIVHVVVVFAPLCALAGLLYALVPTLAVVAALAAGGHVRRSLRGPL